jgi:hypothetical protein
VMTCRCRVCSLLTLPSGGPRNIIPGALVFSLLGAGGQAYLNRREARPPAPEKKPESSGSSWWSRWSPIKRLSDEDYAAILEERVLRTY